MTRYWFHKGRNKYVRYKPRHKKRTSTTISEERPYVCKGCLKSFWTSDELRRHLIRNPSHKRSRTADKLSFFF